MAKVCIVILDHRNDVYLRDLIDGVQRFCPGVDLALYHSGREPPLPDTPAAALPILPCSRPLRYAKVAPFFLDLLEWAATRDYRCVINAETDMAFVQPGFERFVLNAVRQIDYLAPGFSRRTPKRSRWRPYRSLRAELPELLSILGLDYTNRCFSPGQIFGARYVDCVLTSPWYGELRRFVARNQQPGRSFSLQEVLLPTIADALRLRVRDYPSHLARVNRYRPYHAATSVLRARTIPHAHFVHPLRRAEQDAARHVARGLSPPTAAAWR